MSHFLRSTHELIGLKVFGSKSTKKNPDAVRRIGKVRACVFHPTERRCIGFLVKRPDAALMFHRKDMFVAFNGFDLVDGHVMVHDDDAATDKGACKALGINWEQCVLWVGLPVMTADGRDLGLVGNVDFDGETGAVVFLDVTAGATANTLLGRRRIPGELIRGFRFGMGAALVQTEDEEGEAALGAILVDDAAAELPQEGGLAEKAGTASAVVADKAHSAMESAKPKVAAATHAAGEAAQAGAYATGRQLVRAQGMFGNFKEEFKKASASDGVVASKGKASAAAKDSSANGSSKGSTAAIAAAEARGARGAASAAIAASEAGGTKGAASAAAADGASSPDGIVLYEYVDEEGNPVPVDEHGNPVGTDGFIFVDEEGNVVGDDVEIVYVDEEGNPVDEHGNPLEEDIEYVYVDEHGNPVDAQGNPLGAKGAEDDDIVIEAGKASAAKKQPLDSETIGKAVGDHLKKAGGMFDAFKEEYDKARHE